MIAGNFDEFQTGVVNLAPCFVIWYWQHKAYTTPHLIPSLQRRGILKVVGSFIFNHVITDWLYQRRNWPWSTKWESFAMKRMHVLLSTINTFIKKELVLQTRQCWNSVWMASLQSIFMCKVYAAQGVFRFYSVQLRLLTVNIWMTAFMLQVCYLFFIIPEWKL